MPGDAGALKMRSGPRAVGGLEVDVGEDDDGEGERHAKSVPGWKAMRIQGGSASLEVWARAAGALQATDVAVLVAEFLKDTVDVRALEAGLRERRERASYMQVGLNALVTLLSGPRVVWRMGELEQDVLRLVANAADPRHHYLSHISSCGTQIEARVRRGFHNLVDSLVEMLGRAGISARWGDAPLQTPANSDVIVAAATALTMAYDHGDLSYIMSTRLVHVLSSLWTDSLGAGSGGVPASGPAAVAQRGEEEATDTAGSSSWLSDTRVLHSLNRLLVSLLLALDTRGTRAIQLRGLLDCSFHAVTTLYSKATLNARGGGGTWRYFHGQWKPASGKGRARKLFLMLHASEDDLCSQRFLYGSARYAGATYQVCRPHLNSRPFHSTFQP